MLHLVSPKSLLLHLLSPLQKFGGAHVVGLVRCSGRRGQYALVTKGDALPVERENGAK